jgi:hypothetical protein
MKLSGRESRKKWIKESKRLKEETDRNNDKKWGVWEEKESKEAKEEM